MWLFLCHHTTARNSAPALSGGQSPQNCTVRQCVTSKFDIKIFSKFIKIGFTTFKKYGISFKKTYRATSQTSMLHLASNSSFSECHTLTFCKKNSVFYRWKLQQQMVRPHTCQFMGEKANKAIFERKSQFFNSIFFNNVSV